MTQPYPQVSLLRIISTDLPARLSVRLKTNYSLSYKICFFQGSKKGKGRLLCVLI
nr:MAG TPA: hypothetical protein [Caudoviricetes sp.]